MSTLRGIFAPILWIEDKVLTLILGPPVKPEDAYPDGY